MPDGFYDCGRRHKNLPDISDLFSNLYDPSKREAVLIDVNGDAKLRSMLQRSHEIMGEYESIHSRISALAVYVSLMFGGTGSNPVNVYRVAEGLVQVDKDEKKSNVLHVGDVKF
eukprot:gene4871-5020_t